MLIYTRWDYVDRDTNVAHHLWNCYPDGRDPRSFHGKLSARPRKPTLDGNERSGDPRLEQIRGHGRRPSRAGLRFPRLYRLSNRRRRRHVPSPSGLTPDVLLPEAECGTKKIRQYMAYGTPWPLSEDTTTSASTIRKAKTAASTGSTALATGSCSIAIQRSRV